MSRRKHGAEGASTVEIAGRTLGRAVVGRAFGLVALVPLAFGAILLTGSQQFLSERRELEEISASLARETDGEITEAWWRIDFDPDLVEDATNWQAVASPDLCVRVAYSVTGDERSETLFCRRWSRFSSSWALVGDGPLGDRIPWRNARGEATVDVRFSRRAFDWLRGHAAWERYHFGADENPTALEAFDVDLDRPAEHLIRAWTVSGAISLRHDPSHPGRALPARLLDEQLRLSSESARVLYVFGGAGSAMWLAGCFAYSVGLPRWIRAALAFGTLALLPWWGDWVWRGLDSIWPRTSQAAAFFRSELLALPHAVRLEDPSSAGELDDVRHPWTLETSEYAAAFDGLDLRHSGAGLGAEEALRGLVERIAAQLVAFSDERLIHVFQRLERLEGKNRNEAGILFLDPAREISLDDTRPGEVRTSAVRFLRQMAGFGGFVSAVRPASDERLRLWMTLLDHPDPPIPSLAGAVIDKSRQEWSRNGRIFPELRSDPPP